MTRALAFVSLVALVTISSVRAADQDGWIVLFDGKSLDGWKAVENPDSWKVVDGTLVCHGPRSHLFYVGAAAPFRDFEFKAEIKTAAGSNSGVYIHTQVQEEGWPKKGYEVQVNNTHKDPKKTGGLYSVRDVFEAPAKDGEWFEMTIRVQGKHVVIQVDGKTLVDFDEPPGGSAGGGFDRVLGEGTFALQAHDPESTVSYRSLRVKKL